MNEGSGLYGSIEVRLILGIDWGTTSAAEGDVGSLTMESFEAACLEVTVDDRIPPDTMLILPGKGVYRQLGRLLAAGRLTFEEYLEKVAERSYITRLKVPEGEDDGP